MLQKLFSNIKSNHCGSRYGKNYSKDEGTLTKVYNLACVPKNGKIYISCLEYIYYIIYISYSCLELCPIGCNFRKLWHSRQ